MTYKTWKSCDSAYCRASIEKRKEGTTAVLRQQQLCTRERARKRKYFTRTFIVSVDLIIFWILMIGVWFIRDWIDRKCCLSNVTFGYFQRDSSIFSWLSNLCLSLYHKHYLRNPFVDSNNLAKNNWFRYRIIKLI